MTRQLISFDWAIKKILRSKANFGILEGFLSELLKTDIQILEVLESESNQESQYDKFNRVDIKVRDGQQQIIIVEIQYSRELDYLQRILYASAKTISEHMRLSTSYAEITKVISINILYFDFGEGDDYIYHGTTRFVGIHSQHELKLSEQQKNLYTVDKIADIYPEYYLIEVRNFNDIAKNTLDEWVYFLKNEKIEESFTAQGLKQAQEILDVLKMGEKERRVYEAHQTELRHEASLYESTYILGKIEGREEGREEGQKESLLVTAKKMKQAGIQLTLISQITSVPIKTLEKL